jgi:hypothetical protein
MFLDHDQYQENPLRRSPEPFAVIKPATMRHLLMLPLVAAALSRGGCFGIGMVARKAFFDKKTGIQVPLPRISGAEIGGSHIVASGEASSEP